jgi:hypothetical protein
LGYRTGTHSLRMPPANDASVIPMIDSSTFPQFARTAAHAFRHLRLDEATKRSRSVGSAQT